MAAFADADTVKFGAAYVLTLSSFTPPLILYNLKRLYGDAVRLPSAGTIAKRSAAMMPRHVVFRSAQYVLATEVKQRSSSPWLAFAAIGVTQGLVYGDLAAQWNRLLNITKTKASPIRGSPFAAARDMISQGVPFLVGQHVSGAAAVPAVVGASVASTVLSHGLHNAQTVMQMNPSLGHVAAVRELYATHGVKAMYRGALSRMLLMGVTNALNHLLLRHAWQASSDARASSSAPAIDYADVAEME
mmetsp:Transcript_25527/g.62095  ORF Transcript_25527/g.62095 Transcript_25527/m.62095 type:complete len:245 (+) Transcript_25527:116-850(+)|eukprot:CAMPEP_0198317396 /NCGR_PEP_ID=MMETSP1450-20131203/6878_1 /TAXON_ID=753684 ORGANISM="Madagascaria erythrocladiodes, Strain CCMP3234" /NCGR_SAMPLE_ID=MMETSP1450 /ASSEMBLY_ACC=CAM_ASM_001115 /LENGTH=244 /DNA_ID=CAMNT_0044020595 /DNA_START=108 /DNA_END=842 /DNA_ORIENTATION=+